MMGLFNVLLVSIIRRYHLIKSGFCLTRLSPCVVRFWEIYGIGKLSDWPSPVNSSSPRAHNLIIGTRPAITIFG